MDLATVFVSYSRQDFETDGKRPSGPILATALDFLEAETQAVLGTRDRIFWRDTEGLRWGDAWRQTLEDELRQADFLLVLLSPNWLRSEVCVEEFRIFRSRMPETTGRILPILLRDISAGADGDSMDDGIVEELQRRQFADWRMFGQLDPGEVATMCEDHARELARRIEGLRKAGAPNSAPDARSRSRVSGPHRRDAARAQSLGRTGAAHPAGGFNFKVLIAAGLAVLAAGVLTLAVLAPNCSVSVSKGVASCFGINARDITITD